MSVEMDRQDRLEPTGALLLDHILDPVGIQSSGCRVDVRQHRHGAGQLDSRHGGDRRMGDRQDRIAGPDAAGPERDVEGIGAVAHSDGVPHSQITGELLLERADFLTQDIRSAV